MQPAFANRVRHTEPSFIREILKVTKKPDVISFAGGLPNPAFFPTQALAGAATAVLKEDGQRVLQYSTSEGYLPLREFIAERYWTRFQLRVSPDEILITNGSQQGFDLIGKVFLDPGDRIAIESPGYLGAIQAFSMYEPRLCSIPVYEDGIDLEAMAQTLARHSLKLFYTVPNFQNPSGITYSQQKRVELAALLKQHDIMLVEDDPYGELRFDGDDLPSIQCHLNGQVLMLGSFSKIVSPGMRLGWICAPADVMAKLIIVKQATDLHSNYFAQRVVYQYLQTHDLDSHIETIRQAYQTQRDAMIAMVHRAFPSDVEMTIPAGGMFLWLTLPERVSALQLFEIAADMNVAFVPGTAFHIDGQGDNSLRLNFSNSSVEQIEHGMLRLAQALEVAGEVSVGV